MAQDPSYQDIYNALTQNTTEQANISQDRSDAKDWRFRMRLAPSSQALYKSATPGILAPLAATDGVIFPYTPQVMINYQAEYNKSTPTHSNYAQYFYQNSQIESITIQATFTAQSTNEANYLLATNHFFKSCTKMFYGQDTNKGTPPPLVYLEGFGDNQFNEHPCVISQYNMVLPQDVDYVRATQAPGVIRNLNEQRVKRQGYDSALSRLFQLFGFGVTKGAENKLYGGNTDNLIGSDSSYVPTKMEAVLILHPIVSRRRTAQEFSLEDYASGSGLRRGFW